MAIQARPAGRSEEPRWSFRAVQTLSRLNRSHPHKYDVFVLDFQDDAETIHVAFADCYRTTILSDEIDPNRLHDLTAALERCQVYKSAQVDQLVDLYLTAADRDQLDPILDACVAVYKADLDEDGQVDFRGKTRESVRTYTFLPRSCRARMRRGRSCPSSWTS